MGRRQVVILGVTTAVVAAAAIIFGLNYRVDKVDSVETVRIGLSLSAVNGLVFIAAENDFFERHRVNMAMNPYGTGALAVDALLSGAVDVATGAEFVIVQRGFDNGDLRKIMPIKENAMEIGFIRLKKRAAWNVSTVVLFAVLLLVMLSVKDVLAEPLRVGVTSNVHSTLIYLAESQGLFKKEGIDIIIKQYELGPSAIEDLTANRLDIAAAAEFVFVLKTFKDPDIRMLATICSVSNHDLMVRKDRGIAQPGDLKGKRVAIARGTSAEFFLYNYLIFNRIPAESVQVVYQSPSEMINAIAEGTIDAALSWAPHPAEMMKLLGSRGERWPAQSGQDSFVALYAKSPFLKKRPKLMEQFLSVLSKSEAYVTKHPDLARTTMQQRLKAPSGPFLEAWSRSRIQLQLTQDLIILMEREAKWAIRNGLAQGKEVPNYLNFFYFDGLDKVKPEAVSIVH